MANQFETISANLAQLKNYYQGPIVDQFNEDLPIYRGAEKVKQGWSGQQVVRPVRVRRNQGIGATSDGGLLPAIGSQTTVQSLISAKYNYLRFGVTGPMIKASQSDIGSFVRSAAYELEMGYKDLASDCNRQLSWTGTGYLAQIGTTVVGSNSISVIGREGTATGENGDKFLDVGMVVDLVDNNGNVQATGLGITAIPTANALTATVNLSTAVSATAGWFLIRTGTSNNEINGILYQLDGGTSTVFNIARASYPQTQGNVTDNGGAQVTLDKLQKIYNDGLRRGGTAQGKYSAGYMDFDSLRMYQKLLTADKRYMNTVEGDGGFAKKDKFYLDFNGIPFVPDKDCPQRFMFLPMDVFKMYVLAEMEFADETGSMYIAQTAVDALEVRVRFFANLFNELPAGCGVLKNYISP
jgi:hypothetical protein